MTDGAEAEGNDTRLVLLGVGIGCVGLAVGVAVIVATAVLLLGGSGEPFLHTLF